jgi:hypothetical protein
MNVDRPPVSGVEFPATFEQFEAWFAAEEACQQYLARVRWADGVVCTRSGAQGKAWTTSRGL